MFLSKSVKSVYIYVAVYKRVKVLGTYLLFIYIYQHPPVIIKYTILLACILPEKALHQMIKKSDKKPRQTMYLYYFIYTVLAYTDIILLLEILDLCDVNAKISLSRWFTRKFCHFGKIHCAQLEVSGGEYRFTWRLNAKRGRVCTSNDYCVCACVANI